MRSSQTKTVDPAIRFNNLRRRRNRLLDQWSQLITGSTEQKSVEKQYWHLIDKIEGICLNTMAETARLQNEEEEVDTFDFAIKSARRDEAALMLTLAAQTELYPKLRQRYDELSNEIEGPAVSALLSISSRE